MTVSSSCRRLLWSQTLDFGVQVVTLRDERLRPLANCLDDVPQLFVLVFKALDFLLVGICCVADSFIGFGRPESDGLLHNAQNVLLESAAQVAGSLAGSHSGPVRNRLCGASLNTARQRAWPFEGHGERWSVRGRNTNGALAWVSHLGGELTGARPVRA